MRFHVQHPHVILFSAFTVLLAGTGIAGEEGSPTVASRHKVEEAPVHQHLAGDAINIFSNGSAIQTELNANSGAKRFYDKDETSDNRLLEGASDEDFFFASEGYIFGRYRNHGWNPNVGYYNGFNLPNATSAIATAEQFWAQAKSLYAEGKQGEAYWYLGRVAHLMGDMSVPAHVHLDFHPALTGSTYDDDAYEEWMANNYSRYSISSILAPGHLFIDGQDRGAIQPTNYLTLNMNAPHIDTWTSGPTYSTNALNSALFRLFLDMAEISDGFESDDAPGDSTEASSHPDLNGDVPPDELRNHAETLMPEAMKHIAGVYQLFWDETHIPLSNGSPVTNSVVQNHWRFYTIDVPTGATQLTVSTTNASGDVDLYVKFNRTPDASIWDARPYTGSGNETVTFSNPSSGTWVIGVNGYAPGTLSYTITASYTTNPSPPPPPSQAQGLTVTPFPGFVTTVDTVVPLTATVRDQNNNPMPGVAVTFYNSQTPGYWTDAAGNFQSSPGNPPTNASGQSTAYFRPTAIGSAQFNVSTPSLTTPVTFQTIADPGTTVFITPPKLTSRTPGVSAVYYIKTTINTSQGAPVSVGTVRFCTDFGTLSSDTAGSCADDTTISDNGNASATLTVDSSGVANITVTHLQSGATNSISAIVSIVDPPPVQSYFQLVGQQGGSLPFLDGGTNYLAAFENGSVSLGGVALWDMRTWMPVRYWDNTQYPGDWARVATNDGGIAIALDDSTIVVSSDNEIGVFDTNTGSLTSDDSPTNAPGDDIDVRPNGVDFVGVIYLSTTGLTVPLYSSTCVYKGPFAAHPPNGANYGNGIAWSPDDTLIAYGWSNGTNDSFLRIQSPFGGAIIAEPLVDPNSGDTFGVAWSPDSQKIVISTNGNALQIFSRDGAFIRAISMNAAAGSVAWSPDGQYIAAHLQFQGVAIFDAISGEEVARLNGVNGVDPNDSDTVAWRADSKVVVATNSGSSQIFVFAPFDNTPPTISVTSHQSGQPVYSDPIILQGTVADDTGVNPSSAIRWRLDGGAWQTGFADSGNGQYSLTISLLQMGIHNIELETMDLAGQTTTKLLQIEWRDAPFPVTVTWYNPLDITYPAALTERELNAKADVPGGFIYTPSIGTVLNAGNSQTLTAQFIPTDTNRYATPAPITVAINVSKATPLIFWNFPADIAYPTPLGTAQLNATANVPGSFSYSPPSGTVLGAGPGQTLSVQFSPNDATNYNAATASVLINVLKGTATIALSNMTQTADGTPKSPVVTTTPPGLAYVATYNGLGVAPTAAGAYAFLVAIDDPNYSGSASGTFTLNPPSAPAPIITSGPTFSPTQIVAGQVVQFTVASNQSGVTWTWSFGDGSTAIGSGVIHAYNTAGTYTVTVTATNASGQSTSAIVTVTVNPIDGGGGVVSNTNTDTDLDGFADEIETVMGTSPSNANSTPFGVVLVSAPQVLVLSKMSIRLSFSSGRDSISLTGTLPVPFNWWIAGQILSEQTAVVDVGGVVRSYALDPKGSSSDREFKLRVKRTQGVVQAQTAKFSVRLKGSFSGQLNDEGLRNADTPVFGTSVRVPVIVFFNKIIYRVDQNQTYSAKSGKSGRTK